MVSYDLYALEIKQSNQLITTTAQIYQVVLEIIHNTINMSESTKIHLWN